MPRSLAFATLVSVALSGAGAAAGEPPALRACPGIAAAHLKEGTPDEVRHFAFGGAMLEPFLELWSSGRRPHLPLPPERVTVYVVPNHPYLVGFERQGCVIAFLKVDRRKLWQKLRGRIGWPV